MIRVHTTYLQRLQRNEFPILGTGHQYHLVQSQLGDRGGDDALLAFDTRRSQFFRESLPQDQTTAAAAAKED